MLGIILVLTNLMKYLLIYNRITDINIKLILINVFKYHIYFC
jgi:hypothetical protein